MFIAALIGGIQGGGVDNSVAWRYAMAVPTAMLVLLAVPMLFLSDDCPQGAWKDRLYNKKKASDGPKESFGDSLKGMVKRNEKGEIHPALDWRVWVLAAQYACCFGVELAINNSMPSYLYRYFTTDAPECEGLENSNDFPPECSQIAINTASMIASLFGLSNLFARAIGGVASDWAYNRFGVQGRLFVLFICMVGEAAALMIFTFMYRLDAAIVMLIFFSLFVQSSEGATYAIVPVVNSSNIGTVSGIVGAGGNIGAVLWQTTFREMDSQRSAYLVLSIVIFVTSALILIMPVENTYLLCGKRKSKNTNATSDKDKNGVSNTGYI